MIILCCRSSPAPICRKAAECLLSARRGAASRVEASTWRLGRTPVTVAEVSGRTSGLRGTLCRFGPPPSTCWRPCGTLIVLRGNRGRLAVSSRALLSTGGRGVSGKNNQEASDKPGEAASVPGQGLFQFKELYENPWTVPNLLCVCRIVLAPFLGYLIIQQHFHLSLALFTLAGATDLLDGYIARTWPTQKSALGSALDPLADKILISVLYISLTYADIIPAALTALVVFRDIGLIAAVFWVRYKTVPPPVTLSKFFNPCYTTAQLKPTLFSKVNTAIQLVLVAASLAAPVFQYTDSFLLQGLGIVTALTTTASGYSYWHYGRKTVRVLNTRSP
ncbi:cardiolipin synthase (CMP-forming) [Stigmatopora nigra]